MMKRLVLAVVAATTVGCEAPAPSGPPGVVVTLASLKTLFKGPGGQDAPFGVGLDPVFPGGFPPSYFLENEATIRVAPAYTEGEASAYMTTDIWVGFPVVWVQPLYVFVRDWNVAERSFEPWGTVPWLLSVGPKSAFWSPFFRTYYVKVASAEQAAKYRTVREILDAGLPMVEGPTRLVTVAPDEFMGPQTTTDAFLLPTLRPTAEGPRIIVPQKRRGRISGESAEAPLIDFGTDRFEHNDRLEVVEAPLYFFLVRDAQGNWQPVTGAPRVGGTGSPRRTPPVSADNRPAFGSLWRLWGVRLPPTARLFVPSNRGEPRSDANWRSMELPVVAEPMGTSPQAFDAYAYKIMADDRCVTGAAPFPDGCTWLDSQEALERLVPTGLVPSGILVHCPYLAYDKKPVPVR